MKAALQVGEEAGRNRQRRDDAAGRKRVARLQRIHPDEMDVLADLVDRVLDPEPMAPDGDDLRQLILVDERDARLRAPVAGDEADEPCDQQRVGEQDAEQEWRAHEHAQVLPQDEGRAPHVKISSAWSSR